MPLLKEKQCLVTALDTSQLRKTDVLTVANVREKVTNDSSIKPKLEHGGKTKDKSEKTKVEIIDHLRKEIKIEYM